MTALAALIAAEIDRPLAPPVAQDAAAMTARLAARPGVAAVLFYGSRRRSGEQGAAQDAGRGAGPLDFYVLTDSDAAYHGAGLAACANRLLPPSVYAERLARPGGGGTEAKVAVMTCAAFAARMRPDAWDTTLWARFAQPCSLTHARDAAARAAVVAALAQAARTAAGWARALAPPRDGAPDWAALFARTYGAELRPERPGRAALLVAAAPEWFAALSLAVGAPAEAGAPASAGLRWRARVAVGKALNLARLLKAAFTYRGGVAYARAKLRRSRAG